MELHYLKKLEVSVWNIIISNALSNQEAMIILFLIIKVIFTIITT